MVFRKYCRGLGIIVTAMGFVLIFKATVLAQTSSSSSYKTNEYYFGNGGEVDLNSASYKARAAAGALGVENASSANYTANSGTITQDTEYIEFVVNASTINLGNVTTSNTQQGTATFYVKAYVANGYVVRTAATQLAIPSHTMSAPSSATASAIGTEQFGINLAANTCALCLPLTSFGAVPAQIPDSSFSYGAAATGYNTSNLYKYVNGDVIAQSTKSSGQTTYTISYILNISSVTPAGDYTMNHILVATGTY